MQQGGGEAEVAYARLEALCQAIKAELGNDLKIHDAAVLPAFITLPQVTAAEYGRVRACHQPPSRSMFTHVASFFEAPASGPLHMNPFTDCCPQLTGWAHSQSF